MTILLLIISLFESRSSGYVTGDYVLINLGIDVLLPLTDTPETPIIPDTSVCAGSDVTIDFPIDEGETLTETILFEDFEDAEVIYTTSIPEFTDGGQDYFIRTDGGNITGESFLNIQGTSYFAAQDINGKGAASAQTLTFSNIDISGLTNLDFSIFIAEDDNGSSENWDAPDFVHITYSIDGGALQNLIWIENDGSITNSAPFIDSDFDGDGDGAEITPTFTQFVAAIMGTGNLLTLTIDMDLNDDGTDIAFDNIQILGDRIVAPCSYNVYDSDPATTGSVLLAESVIMYSINTVVTNTEFYVTKVQDDCESLADRVLVSVQALSSTTIDSTICLGDIIDFNGQMLSSSGTFRDTIENAAMCDSIVTLNVIVEPLPELTMIVDTLCINETSINLIQYEPEISQSPGTFEYSQVTPVRSTELFISEYVEGSGDNKCIEVYNNTGEDIDLSTYAINFYFNGSSTISRSLSLSGQLLSDDAYVLCDDGIDPALGVVADSLFGGAFYNGDDAISLSNNGLEIDIIGQIGFDPGAQWGSGLISTQNNTLVRNSNINDGDVNGMDAFDPAVEWIGFDEDTFDDIGTHTFNSVVVVTPLSTTVVSVSDGDQFMVEFTDEETGCMASTEIEFVVNDTSSTALDIAICQGEMFDFNGQVLSASGIFLDTLINAAMCDSFVTLNLRVLETIEEMIDTSICQGEFIEFGGTSINEAGLFSDTLMSMAGCDSIVLLNVTLRELSNTMIDSTICLGDIIDFNGQMLSSSGTFRDTLENTAMCDSIVTLNVIVEPLPELAMVTDTLCIDETSAVDLSRYESIISDRSGTFNYSEQEIVRSTELFISEYVEGSGDNKCVELYNNTGEDIDLSTYAIEIVRPDAGDLRIDLTGIITADSSFVLCDNGTDIFDDADQIDNNLGYNGDDAIVLLNGVDTIDVIGQVNIDPGGQWGSGLTSTQNNTLVRNPSIMEGDTDGSDDFEPSLEWIGLEEDFADNLGLHQIDQNVTVSSLESSVVSVDAGDLFIVEFVDSLTGCINMTTIAFEIEQCIFDLALMKVLSSGQSNTVNSGDIVSFDMTIFNQGEVGAYDIVVQDYVPAGLIYNPVINDAPWGSDAIYNSIAFLSAGSDTTITIRLMVGENPTVADLINSAEIIFASASQGGPLAVDEDDDLSNTGGNSEVDNDVDDDMDNIDDQDDFDFASLSFCGDIRFTNPEIDDIGICDPDFDGSIELTPLALQLPADLFFSEYIEGPSGFNNKCLELFNGTGAPINLAGYAVNLYNSAPRLQPDRTLNLSGIIADGDVLVLCNNAGFTDEVDIVDNDVINYNGDDIVSLTFNGLIVDVIGQIGVDPGARWRSGGVSTMDQTLRRIPSIISGDTDGLDVFLPDQEWVTLGDDVNDPSDIGQHIISPPSLNSFTFFDGDPAQGGEPIATQVESLEIDINLESSPMDIWVTTHPLSSTCMSNAIPVRIAIRNEESTMTCIGSVNVSVAGDCSIEDLPVNAFYQGGIDPIFLEVIYMTEDGVSIDPVDVSQNEGERLIYEVVDTCTDLMCWGFVNLNFKGVPDPIIVSTDTICCQDDLIASIDMTIEEVIESVGAGCYAPLSNPTVITMDSIEICDTSIFTLSYFADFDLDSRKENQLLYQQSIVVLPIEIDSIRTPGSYNRLDSLTLVDTIIINECADFIASPRNVAEYWAEIIDPNDQNKNGFQDGIPFAYPHIAKGVITVQDTVVELIEMEIIHEDSLIMINDSVWTRVDVIEKLIDTIITVANREVTEYQLFGEDSSCNIVTKFIDLTKDGCYEDSEILRTWTLIDWCSKTVIELEQWIIFEDLSPPNFGVLPLDVEIIGVDMAIVNGTDTVPLSQIGELVNEDELIETILVQSAFDCVADLDMPQFSNLRDNCTAAEALEFSYNISDPDAIILQDGSEILNISAGVHELIITATDECGNSAMHTMTIVVLDSAEPIAMCQERIHLSYAQNQEGFFTALSLDVIDDGSFDACGDIILRLGQRLDKKVFCEGRFLQFIGTEFIEFCCEDIGSIIPVQLTVFDQFGNTAVCTTEVLVEDKFAPEIVCFELDMDCRIPTIEELISAVDISTSNCFSPQIQFGEIMGPDQCGSNQEQVDVFLDDVRQCAIQINYNSGEQFDPLTIKWPVHIDGSTQEVVLRQCVDNQIIVSSESNKIVLAELSACEGVYEIVEPSWCQVSCNLIGLSHEVTSFGQQNNCRIEIIDWTIIDWCTYEPTQDVSNDAELELMDDTLLDDHNPAYIGQWLPASSIGDSCARCNNFTSTVETPYFRYSDVEVDGHYTYKQIVKFVDDADPVINVAEIDTIYRNQSNGDPDDPCLFSGLIMAEASDFCMDDLSQLSEALSWHVIVKAYRFDERDPGFNDTLSEAGSVIEVLLNSAFDRYDLAWSVRDDCQNSAMAHSIVYLRDNSVAAPICLGEISLGDIDQGGITLHSEDLAISTIMACDDVSILGLSLDNGDQNIVDKLHLTCNQLSMSDSINLRLWSVDRFDNRNFCQVTIRYRPAEDCSNTSISLGGTVNSIFNEAMSNVEVRLFGINQQMMSSDSTDDQGEYLFNPVIDQSEYLIAVSDNSSLSGITTLDIILLQQYVLGITDIENPYLLWAGDINRDGRISAIDISLLRAALLGVIEDTEVGDWFFFDADQTVSPIRPIDPSSAIIDITDLSSMDNTVDLLGMKYGDVSGDSYLARQRSIKDDVLIYYSTNQSKNADFQIFEYQIGHGGGISGFDIQLHLNVTRDIEIYSDDIIIESSDYVVSDDGIRLIWVNSDNSDLGTIVFKVRSVCNNNNGIEHQKISGSAWSNSFEEYNAVLASEGQLDMPEVSVHPNPFMNKANLRISGLASQRVDITIYDGMGSLVTKYPHVSIVGDSNFIIDIEELNGPGLYYFVIKGERRILNGSFIVL